MDRVLAILALVSPFIAVAVWMWLIEFKKKEARKILIQAGIKEALVLEHIKSLFRSCTQDVYVQGSPYALKNELTQRLQQELVRGKKLFEEIPKNSFEFIWPQRAFREFTLDKAYVVGCVWAVTKKMLVVQLEYSGYSVQKKDDLTDTPLLFGATWKLVHEQDVWKLDDVAYYRRVPSFWQTLIAKNLYDVRV